MTYTNCGSESFSYVVAILDCTGRLVVEAFYGSDQIGIDVIQPCCCPQSCLTSSVERILEVHEDVVKVLLELHVFLTLYSNVFLLPTGKKKKKKKKKTRKGITEQSLYPPPPPSLSLSLCFSLSLSLSLARSFSFVCLFLSLVSVYA